MDRPANERPMGSLTSMTSRVSMGGGAGNAISGGNKAAPQRQGVLKAEEGHRAPFIRGAVEFFKIPRLTTGVNPVCISLGPVKRHIVYCFVARCQLGERGTYRLDSYAVGIDGTRIGVLEDRDEVALSHRLDGLHDRSLETDIDHEEVHGHLRNMGRRRFRPESKRLFSSGSLKVDIFCLL